MSIPKAITNIKQLQNGVTYTKTGNEFVPIVNLDNLNNGSHIYIRSGNNVSIYKVDTSAITSSVNVGFGVTNPFSNIPTSAEANSIIAGSKKLAVKIQAGLIAARKMQKKQSKGFLTIFFIGLALLTLLAVVLIATAPAVVATTATTATTTTVATTTALPAGLGIAGASPSSAFLTAGSVIPSAGAGVGIVSTSGAMILPAVSATTVATTAVTTAAKTASTISKIGKVLGITSPAKTALTTASTAGKFLITQQQQKQAEEQMQQYQQAVAQNNQAKAQAIRGYYQKQLEQWERQHTASGNKTVVGSTWGASNTSLLDIKKYLPYIIGGGVLIMFVATKKKAGG